MNYNEIIKKVAKENGVSVEEVERDINALITEAYNSEDPETRKKWSVMSGDGSQPTVEEVLSYFIRRLHAN